MRPFADKYLATKDEIKNLLRAAGLEPDEPEKLLRAALKGVKPEAKSKKRAARKARATTASTSSFGWPRPSAPAAAMTWP